ncbi:hypothetical protein [Sphingomonas psychrotolerans]|uniref:Uncharacterized protein n=1 Tax=Sphingomonas psychrotolerans TaxID=1327635 RepID=A0A2K8MII1_9SPHN|nr:hypothetical protein [Sphingomonas psychrotolerans]ATY33698.1 hypothetical protein CVN68_18485 [Sphingomonas psychrotolerans]
MIGNAIAAFIGNRIDASDGEGGTLGAVAGVAAWKVAKNVVPALLVFGALAYGVHRFASSETAI